MPEFSQTILLWLSLFSLVTFVVSLLSLPWLVALIPEDYFQPKRRQALSKRSHPALRLFLLTAKNLLGGVLLLGGTIMLFLPGQGLLTIAMGLILMDYPGKFRLERRLASKPAVFNGLNWLRGRANKPLLQKPNFFPRNDSR